MTTERERVLEEALRRIADATPHSTNSFNAPDAFSWTHAVAKTALASPLRPEGEATTGEVYVPGEFRCPKCGFALSQFKLRASDGAIGDRDEPGEHCPNDGSPLWRVTWKQRATEHYERAAEELARATKAEAALSARPQPPQQPVAVKPLEWEVNNNVNGAVSVSLAQTPFGYYYAYPSGGWQGLSTRGHGGQETLDAAKFGAQANYETRIRSALYAAPLAQPVATAGEEREKLATAGELALSKLALLDGKVADLFFIAGWIESARSALRPPVTHAEEAGK